MISVAQQHAVPIVPVPRRRFTAMTVSRDPRALAGLAPRLRSLGAVAIHEAATARSASCPSPGTSADVCVLDARGVELPEELRWLSQAGWRRIVVVASTADQARQAGGLAVRCVVSPPAEAADSRARPASVRTGGRGMADDLSDREIQVLQRVADGHSNKQIGDDLCLSALTVKSHLARIARKLGTGDRAEMVAISIRSGIVA